MRILIAEDHEASRLILNAAVRSLGHECLAAANGADAWQVFAHADVDVVISDRMMPVMDGIELCRRIRAHKPDRYTYFIFLTGLHERNEIVSGIEAGADDYLVKPLDVHELRMRLLVASRVTALHRQLSRQSAELAQLNRKLFDQARTDSLTQLGSRLKLREDLETIYAGIDRYGYSCCAVMCDIDNFKLYNDTHGHLAGDEVLQSLARALLETIREGDRTYRYGGEEFLILMPEQSIDTGFAAAERHRQAVEDMAIPHDGNPPSGIVTISAGIAVLSNPLLKSVEAWLKEADAALYRAKQLGRNRVVVHDVHTEMRDPLPISARS
jgi:two-component system cell cycle response regulator